MEKLRDVYGYRLAVNEANAPMAELDRENVGGQKTFKIYWKTVHHYFCHSRISNKQKLLLENIGCL